MVTKALVFIFLVLILAFATFVVVAFHRSVRRYQKDGGLIMFPPGTGDVSQDEMRRIHEENMKQPMWRRMLGLGSK